MKKFLIKSLAIGTVMLGVSLGVSAQKQKMTAELLWKLGRVSGEAVSPDGKNLYYGVTTYNLDENKGNRNLFMVSVNGGTPAQVTSLEGSEYNLQFSANGKTIYFLNGGQIWMADANGENAQKITDHPAGISGFKLSPDGKKVAYTSEVKIGKTTADLYPNLPKAEAMVIDDLMYRHWDHWEDELRSHLFVADFSNNGISKAIDLMEGEPYDCPLQPFGGTEDFTWSPTGDAIAYVSKKETGVKAAQSTNSDIYIYSLSTKQTVNHTKGMNGYDTHPAFSADGTRLFWLTMSTPSYESDKNLLMSKPINGEKNIIRYTGHWDHSVTGFTIDEQAQAIYLNGGENATYQIYKLDISSVPTNGYSITNVTQGQHNIGTVIGFSNGKVYATKTDMNHAAEIYSFDISKGKEKQLTTVNDAIYKKVEMSNVEARWIDTRDGQKMLVWVIYPPNFDKNKQYPALLYCQGGPQSAVSQFYSFRWNFQLMAANDYIIIAPNRRGLPTFGEEWNRAISTDWGGMPMQDYMQAVDVMREEPFIDANRIGAVGASYGGYSVYMLAGIHENRFCSFISHCGLFNLESWYGTTEELFFANFDIGGPYWRSNLKTEYQKNSPHTYVGNWNAPMLVIHGGMDFRVPINQGMEAFQAAKLMGLKSKFLYFPNEGHWVLSPQNGMIWHTEFFNWLDETVKNRM